MVGYSLGEVFPNFRAPASGYSGSFDLYEYLGDSWGILFSHPNDFTPVCTTELAEAVKLSEEFLARNCKIVGFSCNDIESHDIWSKDILSYADSNLESLPYPIVADKSRAIAVSLGIMDPDEKDIEGLPLSCRSVTYIGLDKRVKATILYPATTGRSFKEILRVLDSLQLTAAYPVATPVEWTPGGKCMVIPSLKDADVNDRLPKGFQRVNLPTGLPYMRLTPDPQQ